MRQARISIARHILMRDNGLSKDVICQILQALPADACITGFTESLTWGTCYILVTSQSFKEVYGGDHSSIGVQFESTYDESGYVVKFRKLDMSEAIEKSSCCKPSDMKLYTGLMDSYNYCVRCGKKEVK